MIVNGFEIFRFYAVGAYPLIVVQACGDISDQVLDEFGVIIGTFGDEFFIRTLDQAINLARGLIFHNFYKVFYPYVAINRCAERDVGALIMGTIV